MRVKVYLLFHFLFLFARVGGFFILLLIVVFVLLLPFLPPFLARVLEIKAYYICMYIPNWKARGRERVRESSFSVGTKNMPKKCMHNSGMMYKMSLTTEMTTHIMFLFLLLLLLNSAKSKS